MRKKRVLATILLAAVLCFVVSGVGYGEINFPTTGAIYEGWDEYYTHPLLEEQPFLGLRKDIELLRLQHFLLGAIVEYIMRNPVSFLYVSIDYDDMGIWQPIYKLPENVDTRHKVCLRIGDNRNSFYDKSVVALLDEFKRELEVIYSFLELWVTDLSSDVVAILLSTGGIPLAYFYQGEYHLWDE